MTGFKVDPPRLEAFARTSEDRTTAYTTVRATMHDIRLGRDAFGHIPFLGNSIYQAYDEHVEACEEAVTSAATAMAAIASGIRAVVAAYQDGDARVGEDLAAWQHAVDAVRVREPR
jgi:hypothetical protein